METYSFYQTSWFVVSMAALVPALIFTAYRLRIRHFERQARDLETVLSLRTREIRTHIEMTAELEMEEMPLQIEEIDLSLLVERVADGYRPMAVGKRQMLSVSTGEECTVMGDERRLYAVIETLLGHAVRCSPAGKRVRVSVDRDYDTVRLCVRDEGPKHLDGGRVRRLHKEPTDGESAMDPGWSNAGQIIDLHGGQLRVDRAHAAGKTVVVEMTASDRALRKAVA